MVAVPLLLKVSALEATSVLSTLTATTLENLLVVGMILIVSLLYTAVMNANGTIEHAVVEFVSYYTVLIIDFISLLKKASFLHKCP